MHLCTDDLLALLQLLVVLKHGHGFTALTQLIALLGQRETPSALSEAAKVIIFLGLNPSKKLSPTKKQKE